MKISSSYVVHDIAARTRNKEPTNPANLKVPDIENAFTSGYLLLVDKVDFTPESLYFSVSPVMLLNFILKKTICDKI